MSATSLRTIALLFVIGMMPFAGTHLIAQEVFDDSPDGVWKVVRPDTGLEFRHNFLDAMPRNNVLNAFKMSREIEVGTLIDVDSTRLQRSLDRDQILSLPGFDGEWLQFNIKESPSVIEESDATRPKLQMFTGLAANKPNATVAVAIDESGVYAKVSDNNREYWLKPIEGMRHLALEHGATPVVERLECTTGTKVLPPSTGRRAPIRRYGEQVKVYRLAMACTSEFSRVIVEHHRARIRNDSRTDKEIVDAAIRRMVFQINQVFLRDVSIELQLVQNNDDLIFTDAESDPFLRRDEQGRVFIGENDQSQELDLWEIIAQSQLVIDEKIQSENYDVGHTLCTLGNGSTPYDTVAGTGDAPGSAFVEGEKAKAATGHPQPFGDRFIIDFVAHELAHQFGANHVFSLNDCGRVEQHTSVEPLSGSTIMSYTGICPDIDSNLQEHSDHYLNSVNIWEMVEYCHRHRNEGTLSKRPANMPPQVKGGFDYYIPQDTPFVLTASGEDEDGDSLLYCWEQIDPYKSSEPPLFRSFMPAPVNHRCFPSMSRLLTENNQLGEQLPSDARELNFRVTARDTKGGVASDDVRINVMNATSFRITKPAAGEPVSGIIDVEWTHGSTNEAPFHVTHVEIRYSLDGGRTFQRSGIFENNGRAKIRLPNRESSNTRIQVRSIGNVFFAISQPIKLQNQTRDVVVAPRSVIDEPESRRLAELADHVFLIESDSVSLEASALQGATQSFDNPVDAMLAANSYQKGESILVIGADKFLSSMPSNGSSTARRSPRRSSAYMHLLTEPDRDFQKRLEESEKLNFNRSSFPSHPRALVENAFPNRSNGFALTPRNSSGTSPRIVLFDLGNTLELQDRLRPGALRLLNTLSEMSDVHQRPPVLALLSDYYPAQSAEHLVQLRVEYVRFLERIEIQDFFQPYSERVTLSTDLSLQVSEIRKPDPQLFRFALDRIDQSSNYEDVIFITENEEHVAAARELGMQAIQVTDSAEFDLMQLEPRLREFVESAATEPQRSMDRPLVQIEILDTQNDAFGSTERRAFTSRVRFGNSTIATRPVTASQPESTAPAIPENELYIVTQVGSSFEQHHSDVPILFNRGRYLLARIDEATRQSINQSLEYKLEPFRGTMTAFKVRERSTARRGRSQEIESLLELLDQNEFVQDVNYLSSPDSFPTRHSTSSHFLAAATWSKEQLEALGMSVHLMDVDIPNETVTSRNVIANLEGNGEERQVIIVTAHLDSISDQAGTAPGADDNASGSAGVLQIARVLSTTSLKHDVRFILFGGEEQGLFGSSQYVSDLTDDERERIKAVINMDMIGVKNTSIGSVLIEGSDANRAAEELIEQLTISAATYSSLQVQTSTNAFGSDHVPFLSEGIPAILTIEGADRSNTKVHTVEDTADRIDADFAMEILKINLAAIIKLGNE